MPETYIPASYNGIGFKVASGELEAGRRTVLYEFPMRDVPATEDVGRSPRKYQVEGYLLGDDVLDKAQELADAFELPGPGELVHPIHGTLRVSLLEPAQFNFTMREHRIVRFSVGFVQVDNAKTFQAPQTNKGDIEKKVNDLQGVARVTASIGKVSFVDKIEKRVDYIRKPKAIWDLALEEWRKFLRNLKDVFKKFMRFISMPVDILNAFFSALDEFDRFVSEIISDIGSLTLAAIDVARKTRDLLAGQYKFNAPDAWDYFCRSLADAVANFGFPIIQDQYNDYVSTVAKRNRENVVAFMQQICLGELAYATCFTEYESRQEIDFNIRRFQETADLVEYQASTLDMDTVVPRISDLRWGVVSYLNEVRLNLPNQTTERVPRGPMSAKVLAWELYQDIDRESDILEMNSAIIRHPGFLPSNTELQVLTE